MEKLGLTADEKNVALLRRKFPGNESLSEGAPQWVRHGLRKRIEKAKEFKSPLSVVAGFLLQSREAKAAKCKQLREENNELKRRLEEQTQKLEQQGEELARLKRQMDVLEMRRAESSPRSIVLPDDPPIGSHGYGARMVALAVNLARLVGLRGAARVIETFFRWLGITQKTPDWTTIRTWLGRLGIAALQEPIEHADDWIWMADHSNQTGPEKALVLLGVRASRLPKPGTALTHEDVCVVTVEPGTEWKQENMAEIYDELAERFKAFNAEVGKTRAAIQQTELAHLTPPGSKPKARFINLAATL